MWFDTYQSLLLYWGFLPYRYLAAMSTEMRNVREILKLPSAKLRTPLLSLHVNTLPLILRTERKKKGEYLQLIKEN